MLNLSTILEASARENPEKEAIIFMDRRITYQEINGAANAVANALLEAGIQKGDKVALMCPNLPYFPVAYYRGIGRDHFRGVGWYCLLAFCPDW